MKAYFLSLLPETPADGFWDYGILSIFLQDFEKVECSELKKDDSAVVVIPARSHHNEIKRINKELKKINGVVLFLMGDEEHVFPVEEINHPNIKIYVQNPDVERHSKYRMLGTGFTPQVLEFRKQSVEKDLDWFFAGQITHERRQLMARALADEVSMNSEYLPTKSFTAGYPPKQYIETLQRAKVAPCPSGPETPDSFRLFEALELGVVPIADTCTPRGKIEDFWQILFDDEVPFPVLENYDSLVGYMIEVVNMYPIMNNKVFAWWQRRKKRYQREFKVDIKSVGGDIYGENITAVIPVSPIKSHPDTRIVDETINSILFHLPKAEIIVTFDGIRDEQADMTDQYNEFIRRMLDKYNGVITPYIFDEHTHQAGMMKAIIDEIHTDFILYMEQDTPLVIDYDIDFVKLGRFITNGQSDLIRFHFEANVPEEHYPLMIGEPKDELLKTVQWSQRPHLSSVAFYRRILKEHFTEDAKCFIEDNMHGVVQSAYYQDGLLGWNQFKLHIYHPKGNIKRSYHTDGREGGAKYDDTQIF